MKSKLNTVIDRLRKINFNKDILCSVYWAKLLKLQEDFNEESLWDLLISNMEWLQEFNVVTTEDLRSWFSEEELNSRNIYTRGTHEVENVRVIALGVAKIKAMGNCLVLAYQKAEIEAYDTTTVLTFNEAKAVLDNCSGDAFGNSTMTLKNFAKGEGWDGSKLIIQDKSIGWQHLGCTVESESNCVVFTDDIIES